MVKIEINLENVTGTVSSTTHRWGEIPGLAGFGGIRDKNEYPLGWPCCLKVLVRYDHPGWDWPDGYKYKNDQQL
jgi:hypothetical protein